MSKDRIIIRHYKEFSKENSANPEFRLFTDRKSSLDMLLYNSTSTEDGKLFIYRADW